MRERKRKKKIDERVEVKKERKRKNLAASGACPLKEKKKMEMD